MTILKRIKDKTAKWWLSDTYREIELTVTALEAREAKLCEAEERNSKLTVTDLVRDQLKGFSPRMLDPALWGSVDEAPDILAAYEGEEGDASFLEAAKELHDNKALEPILSYLARNQVLYSAKEANQMAEINFGRATVNGLTLFREEIARLYGLYQEKHKREEPFNPEEVV